MNTVTVLNAEADKKNSYENIVAYNIIPALLWYDLQCCKMCSLLLVHVASQASMCLEGSSAKKLCSKAHKKLLFKHIFKLKCIYLQNYDPDLFQYVNCF